MNMRIRVEALVEEIAKANPNNGAYKMSKEELNLFAIREIKDIAVELEKIHHRRWLDTMGCH